MLWAEWRKSFLLGWRCAPLLNVMRSWTLHMVALCMRPSIFNLEQLINTAWRANTQRRRQSRMCDFFLHACQHWYTHFTKSTITPPTKTISPKNGTSDDIDDADSITELITFISLRFFFYFFLILRLFHTKTGNFSFTPNFFLVSLCSSLWVFHSGNFTALICRTIFTSDMRDWY